MALPSVAASLSSLPSVTTSWPGVALPMNDTTRFLHHQLMRMWEVPKEKYEGSSNLFLYNPAPNPVSFKREHYHTLKSADYLVGEKTHGQRCLLVMTRTAEGTPVNIILDRKCFMFSIRLAAPKALYNGIGSCFDGELIHENGKWFYVVFDLVSLSGISYLHTEDYLERLERAREVLVEAEDMEEVDDDEALRYAKGGQVIMLTTKAGETIHPAIHLRLKPVYPLHEIQKAYEGSDEYASDGLIFTPRYCPIRKERHDLMIKVKALEANTADFRLVVTKRPKEKERLLEFRYRCHGKEEDICAGDGFNYIGYSLAVSVGESRALQDILGRFRKDRSGHVQSTIVECQLIMDLNTQTLELVVTNERTDKTTPNNLTTLYGTLETIQTGVGCEDLVKEFRTE